jgi:hypothetical protein
MRGLALTALLCCGCARGPAATADEAAARALQCLFAWQAGDGAFRSDVHGVLKPGFSLTATALLAVAMLPARLRAPHQHGIDRALAFLARATGPEGAIGLGGTVDYPTYTSAHYLHALCLLHPSGWRQLADVQLAHLRNLQLGEAQGWQSADFAWGGFGFGVRAEPKPLGAELLNLPLTTSVLEAVRAAGVQPGDPVLVRARAYVERCQRMPGEGDPDGDGGFFFTPEPDFRRSKAGDETGADGFARGRSYGTTTCDGIRALLACGAGDGDVRLRAARAWLQRHLRFDVVPGLALDAAPPVEPALRFYWWATLARTLAALQWPDDWRARLFRELAPRQHSDGGFTGFSDRMKEDDPIVATSLALFALSALCRD